MRSHMTPIALNRLERPQVEALIIHMAEDKTLPDEVIEYIVTKTDGVPLYVEELTKMLLTSNLLQEEADQYVLTGPLSTLAIPDTLQDSLMARLDQMNTAKEVAQLGAVLGRDFSYVMLQAISSQEEEVVQAGLTQLVEAELLYQRGRPPRAQYIFKHALIQDAAYASLLRNTRLLAHQRIAQLVEAQFPEIVETQPEWVAHHYTEANCLEQALLYWRQAGEHALQQSAYPEAIAHLTQGLTLLRSLPETPEHQQQELDLQVVLGPALIAIKGQASPDVEHAYTRAQALCQQLGDALQLLPVLRGLTLHYMVRGQMQIARELGERQLRLAEPQQATVDLMHAHYTLGVVLLWRGEPATAHRHHTQAIAIYNPQAHRDSALRHGVGLGIVSRVHLGYALWQLGYPDQALQHSQATRMLAQDATHPYSFVLTLLIMAVMHQCRRETSAVLEHTETLTSLARKYGFVLWLGWGTVLHGWACVMLGERESGIAEMRQGIAADHDIGSKMMQPYFLGLLAEAYGKADIPRLGCERWPRRLT